MRADQADETAECRDFAAAIHLYDVYIAHILDMTDMLITGVIEQFPTQFR